MKKILILLLAGTMVFTMAACGDKDTASGDDILSREDTVLSREDAPLSREESSDTAASNENEGSKIPKADFSAIMMGQGSTDIVWGKQDIATKALFKADAKEMGLEASFGEDGSTTLTADDFSMTQKPDGSWVNISEEDGETQFGDNWPENEFTKLLPKPAFPITMANSNGDEFVVVFENPDLDALRAYAQKVKAAGFDQNVEVMDENVMGMVIYTYSADHASGYHVEVFSASGTSGITVTK